MPTLVRVLCAVVFALACFPPAGQAQSDLTLIDAPPPAIEGDLPQFVPGQVVVRWSALAARLESARQGLAIADLALPGLISLVRVDAGAEQRMAALLSRIPGVEWAEPDGYVR